MKKLAHAQYVKVLNEHAALAQRMPFTGNLVDTVKLLCERANYPHPERVNLCGAYSCLKTNGDIYVDGGFSSSAKLASLAHELGHYHHYRGYYERGGQSPSYYRETTWEIICEEIGASEYACHLLRECGLLTPEMIEMHTLAAMTYVMNWLEHELPDIPEGIGSPSDPERKHHEPQYVRYGTIPGDRNPRGRRYDRNHYAQNTHARRVSAARGARVCGQRARQDRVMD